MTTSAPSDDMIVLAALLEGREWRLAAEIASTLHRLGFQALTPQQMVGQLKRLAAEDMPMIECRLSDWARRLEYRVTRFGKTQIGNHFPLASGLLARPFF